MVLCLGFAALLLVVVALCNRPNTAPFYVAEARRLFAVAASEQAAEGNDVRAAFSALLRQERGSQGYETREPAFEPAQGDRRGWVGRLTWQERARGGEWSPASCSDLKVRLAAGRWHLDRQQQGGELTCRRPLGAGVFAYP